MRKILIIIFIFTFFPGLIFAAAFERDLYFGMRGDADVIKLQQFLQSQGIYSGPITGNLFSLTQEGIKKFQKKEGITPASGYFGPKTRVKANILASLKPQSGEGGQVAILTAQINILQAQLKLLQEKLIAEQSQVKSTTTQVTADVTPPVFTKSPQISQSGFIPKSPLGAHYPYRVTFDWAVDEIGFVEESVECSPALKTDKPAGRATEYFPEPHTKYSCSVAVKDSAQNKTSGKISFVSPNWISISGDKTINFPDVVATVLKIGEFTVYNGTTTDILFTSFNVDIIDEMDSTFNRGRKVYFLLRDGAAATDTIISSNEFTFVTTPPKINEPYKVNMNFSYPILLKSGEEKKASLWIEQLEFVKSGTLKIKSTKLGATTIIDTVGGFDFLLTKEPSI